MYNNSPKEVFTIYKSIADSLIVLVKLLEIYFRINLKKMFLKRNKSVNNRYSFKNSIILLSQYKKKELTQSYVHLLFHVVIIKIASYNSLPFLKTYIELIFLQSVYLHVSN